MRPPLIDVVIPVHNEAETLPAICSRWHRTITRITPRYRFIICEDGSTDGTQGVITRLAHRYPVVARTHPFRLGYGPAVLAGIRQCSAPFVVHIDSDDQYAPADFLSLWNRRNEAEIISGVRTKRCDPLHRLMLSYCFKRLFSVLFSPAHPDPSCPFVLYRRAAILPYLRDLTCMKEGFWWGFEASAEKHGISRIVVPVRHYSRNSGATKVYSIPSIPGIFIRNTIGLFNIRFRNSHSSTTPRF